MRQTLACALLIGLLGGSLLAQDWPRFRGPNGSGVGTASDLPIELSPDTAAWVTPVLLGRSSPIVVDDLVLLTGAEEAELVTLALDSASGEPRWR